mgnify:CR=1 FL=1
MPLLAQGQKPSLLQVVLFEKRVRSTFSRRRNDFGRHRLNGLDNKSQPLPPGRLLNLTPPRIVPNPVEEVMAFLGQRADAESPNAIVRIFGRCSY